MFNVGVITPWDTSLTNDFLPVILVFINIHDYANEIIFILDHCITYDKNLQHCWFDVNFGLKSVYLWCF